MKRYGFFRGDHLAMVAKGENADEAFASLVELSTRYNPGGSAPSRSLYRAVEIDGNGCRNEKG